MMNSLASVCTLNRSLAIDLSVYPERVGNALTVTVRQLQYTRNSLGGTIQ
jgi:hypothetical protein